MEPHQLEEALCWKQKHHGLEEILLGRAVTGGVMEEGGSGGSGGVGCRHRTKVHADSAVMLAEGERGRVVLAEKQSACAGGCVAGPKQARVSEAEWIWCGVV